MKQLTKRGLALLIALTLCLPLMLTTAQPETVEASTVNGNHVTGYVWVPAANNFDGHSRKATMTTSYSSASVPCTQVLYTADDRGVQYYIPYTARRRTGTNPDGTPIYTYYTAYNGPYSSYATVARNFYIGQGGVAPAGPNPAAPGGAAMVSYINQPPADSLAHKQYFSSNAIMMTSAGLNYTATASNQHGYVGGVYMTVQEHQVGWSGVQSTWQNGSGSASASYTSGQSPTNGTPESVQTVPNWIESIALQIEGDESNPANNLQNFYYADYRGHAGTVSKSWLSMITTKIPNGLESRAEAQYIEGLSQVASFNAMGGVPNNIGMGTNYVGAQLPGSPFNTNSSFIGTVGRSATLNSWAGQLTMYPQDIYLNTDGGTIDGKAYNTTIPAVVDGTLYFGECPEKPGYVFKEWDIRAVYYTANDTISQQYPKQHVAPYTLTNDLFIYCGNAKKLYVTAKYEPIYTLTFDDNRPFPPTNGRNASMAYVYMPELSRRIATTYPYGTAVESRPCVPTSSAHIYPNHWYYNRTCEHTHDMVIWKTLPTPTLTGYRFNGWWTKRTGGRRITDATIYTLRSDSTLYAHWIDESDPVLETTNGNASNTSWTNKPVTLTYRTYDTDRYDHTFEDTDTADVAAHKMGSGIQKETITINSHNGVSRELLMAYTGDGANPSTYNPALTDTMGHMNWNSWKGTTQALFTSYTHRTEGAYSYRIDAWDWDSDVMIDGVLHNGHTTIGRAGSEAIQVKYDETDPEIDVFTIHQTRLADVDTTQKTMALAARGIKPHPNGGTVDGINYDEETINGESDWLDDHMLTTLTLKVSDFQPTKQTRYWYQEDTSAFFKNDATGDNAPDGSARGRDSSGIKEVQIIITGDNGQKLTLSTDPSHIEDPKYQLSISDSVLTAAGSAYNTFKNSPYNTFILMKEDEDHKVKETLSWTGNLYEDSHFRDASALHYQIIVYDYAGNISNSDDGSHQPEVWNNNHPSVKDPTDLTWHSDNFDMKATIFRNEFLNQKYNGLYLDQSTSAAVKSFWESIGTELGTTYEDYNAFFTDQYNFFRYGEYAIVQLLTYGNVENVQTQFNSSSVALTDLRNAKIQKGYTAESFPTLDRQYTFDLAWEGLTKFQYPEDQAAGAYSTDISLSTLFRKNVTGYATYNTRIPLSDIDFAINGGLKDFIAVATKRDNTLTRYPGYALEAMNKPAIPDRTPDEQNTPLRMDTTVDVPKRLENPDIGGIETDTHVRITTNHSNGNLEYK